MTRKILGALVIAYGVMLLLRKMGYDFFDWFFQIDWATYFWPAVIIFVGILIISGGKKDDKKQGSQAQGLTPEMEGDRFNASAFLTGGKYNFAGLDFKGAKVSAFMGGITLDLRGANIADGAVIDASAFMGGFNIFVDPDTTIVTQSSCFLGGVDNKHTNAVAGGKTLVVKASCFMGGVDVK